MIGVTDEPPMRTPPIDPTQAHPARVYDALLGGKDNYAPDRDVAGRMADLLPDLVAGVRRNREFVVAAVRLMVGELGIRQIVDIGSGVPTSPSVHEVARGIDPATVVVYADNDPLVLAHDRALLGGRPGVVTVAADLTDPPSILDHPELTGLVDWDRPVALVIAAVLHFLPDDECALGYVARYRDALAPGSAIALSMATSEGRTEEEAREIERTYASSQPFVLRSRERIAEFLDGLRLVGPGIVDIAEWHPGAIPGRTGSGMALGAVGVKPHN